jgi:hypothetical protein
MERFFVGDEDLFGVGVAGAVDISRRLRRALQTKDEDDPPSFLCPQTRPPRVARHQRLKCGALFPVSSLCPTARASSCSSGRP